jgi:hypothetical protein
MMIPFHEGNPHLGLVSQEPNHRWTENEDRREADR